MSTDELPFTPPLCAIFRRFLKRKGLKFTTERAVILEAVLAKDGLFEVEELCIELKDVGHEASRATVYRTLKHLMEAGIVQEVLLDATRSHYQVAFGRKPTGHLVCVETHQVIEFPTEELDALMNKICKDHGYEPLSHRFVVYGMSPAARKIAPADPE